ncbi:MAG: guanylate kinase [Candidatus Kerfeldbacteria bacterium]|nr:guanylate kinase [Candidatus Kerfeldbacteria bacterium]
MTTTKAGKLFIISGPSQIGKDSIVRALWRDRTLKLTHVITNTTRAKRPGERQGVTYNFMNEKAFVSLIKRGKLLEWATVRQAYFGTPKKPVELALKQGRNIILQIDVQGAAQVKAKLPATVLIFISAENAAEVKRRIFASTKMTDTQKKNRWLEAQKEFKSMTKYNHVVINHWGKLNQAIAEVKEIICQHLQTPEP